MGYLIDTVVQLVDMALGESLGELLRAIDEAAEVEDLAALVLVCPLLNEAMKPLLYAQVDLQRRFAIYRRVETLAPSHDELIYGRDLVGMVETLSLADPGHGYPPNSVFTRSQRNVIKERLLRTLPRMRKLR